MRAIGDVSTSTVPLGEKFETVGTDLVEKAVEPEAREHRVSGAQAEGYADGEP